MRIDRRRSLQDKHLFEHRYQLLLNHRSLCLSFHIPLDELHARIGYMRLSGRHMTHSTIFLVSSP